MSDDTQPGHILTPTDFDYESAELAADLAIGDRVLHVDNAIDFDELAEDNGGKLLLGVEIDSDGNPDLTNAATLAYVTCDKAAQTITLEADSPVAGSSGDQVYLADPVTGKPVGQVTVDVQLDGADFGDALPAYLDAGLLDGFSYADLTGQAVDLEEDEDGQLQVVNLPGLTSASSEVRFEQDYATATGSGDVVVLLKYRPIVNSEHVYWNGKYQSGFTWSRDGWVLTVHDDGRIAAGDVFWVEYAYRDPSPRPEQTITADLPGTIQSFDAAFSPTSGIHAGASPASGAVSTDDGDDSYVKIVGVAVTSGVTGWTLQVKFDPKAIPGTLDSTELVVVSKGPDSRTATAGQTTPLTSGMQALIDQRDATGAYIDGWSWDQVDTETTDGSYAETVTALQHPSGVEFVTQAMVEGGRVEYLHGQGITLTDEIEGGSPGPSIAYEQHITYVALRLTYTIPAWDGTPDDFSVDDAGEHDPRLTYPELPTDIGTGGGSGTDRALRPLTTVIGGENALVWVGDQLVMVEVTL